MDKDLEQKLVEKLVEIRELLQANKVTELSVKFKDDGIVTYHTGFQFNENEPSLDNFICGGI